MKTPHTKAYIIINTYVLNGEVHESTKIVATMPGAPDIHSYIEKLNSLGSGQFRLVEEIPVQKAIYKRSISGSTIAVDWRLLDTFKHHTIEIGNKVLIN